MADSFMFCRSERIKMIMFPELYEALENSEEVLSKRDTITKHLVQPTNILRTAVIELINLQDESELTIRAIPELVKLLGDKDEMIVRRAAHMIHVLSKESRSGVAIASNPALISALISAICFDNDSIRRDALAALAHISEYEQGRMHLFRSGGIPELVKMLSVPADVLRHYAITTLHNLLLYLESAKQETRNCGGVEAMTSLLSEPNPRFLALLTDSLYLVMLDHAPSKLSFLSLNGPALLVSLLNSYRQHPKLIYTIIRCIRAISVCPQNEAALIALGALQLLGDFIDDFEERTQIALLCAIRNLSDAATAEDNLSPLIIRLINVISTGEESLTACASGILSNLTCNNVRNKQALCMHRGVAVLCSALENFASVEEITEPTLCALRHCTARHPLASQAQSDIHLSQTLPVILELLSTMRAPVVKAALGLIRNLALLSANRHSLGNEITMKGDTVVTLAMNVLCKAGTQLLNDPEAAADGVAMRELVEGAVSALHQLANHAYVANVMLNDHSFMEMLIKLLSSDDACSIEDELLQRELLGLIYQLSKTVEGSREVDSYDPTPFLLDALRSKSKAIATYASGVLKNLQRSKPIVYREELETEIESAILEGDEWMHDGLEPELFAEIYQSVDIDRIDRNYPSQAPLYNSSMQNPPWFDTDL